MVDVITYRIEADLVRLLADGFRELADVLPTSGNPGMYPLRSTLDRLADELLAGLPVEQAPTPGVEALGERVGSTDASWPGRVQREDVRSLYSVDWQVGDYLWDRRSAWWLITSIETTLQVSRGRVVSLVGVDGYRRDMVAHNRQASFILRPGQGEDSPAARRATQRADDQGLPGMWESADFTGGSPDLVREPTGAGRAELAELAELARDPATTDGALFRAIAAAEAAAEAAAPVVSVSFESPWLTVAQLRDAPPGFLVWASKYKTDLVSRRMYVKLAGGAGFTYWRPVAGGSADGISEMSLVLPSAGKPGETSDPAELTEDELAGELAIWELM